jgi:hypothetical protein
MDIMDTLFSWESYDATSTALVNKTRLREPATVDVAPLTPLSINEEENDDMFSFSPHQDKQDYLEAATAEEESSVSPFANHLNWCLEDTDSVADTICKEEEELIVDAIPISQLNRKAKTVRFADPIASFEPALLPASVATAQSVASSVDSQTTNASAALRTHSSRKRKYKQDSAYVYEEEEEEEDEDVTPAKQQRCAAHSPSTTVDLVKKEESIYLDKQLPVITQEEEEKENACKLDISLSARVVCPALKLCPSAEINNLCVEPQELRFRSSARSYAFRMRLVRVTDQLNKTRMVLIHAGNLGNVIVSSSNVSRLFAKYSTPSEKIMMPFGKQEANAITIAGVRRFMNSNVLAKADPTHDYRDWLSKYLLPYMLANSKF